jgi:transketolase
MDMEAQIGGAASHYGGPAAFAELMAALHGQAFERASKRGSEWYDLFHIVNDAGHCENGLYALKANYGMAGLTLESLAGFRSIQSPLSGHGEAHLFPEGVLISNGPLGSGLPQAQGLAVADALLRRTRTTICALSDGGAMEGEAREALAAIPGLAARGKLAPFVLIISDNQTKLSGRIEQDAFSMEPTFKSLERLGWRVITLPDGHNLQACWLTIGEALDMAASDPGAPVVIHARTIKGKGHKKSEDSASGGHGFSLKSAAELPAMLTEIYSGQQPPDEIQAWAGRILERERAVKAQAKAAPPSEKIQVGVAKALIEARTRGLPVVSVTSDLPGSTGVAEFHKKFPGSSLDVGVAEANMISTAAGLSLAGCIPFVDTFAQFGVTKGALPITMANLSNAPLIAVFSHTGFQDAADGASHQALAFYAQVSSIPGVEVFSLSCSAEAHALVAQAIERFAADRQAGRLPPSQVFFLGRENFPQDLRSSGTTYRLGWPTHVLTTSTKSSVERAEPVVLVAGGSLVLEACQAAEQLLDHGITCEVFHSAAINRPNLSEVRQALTASQGRIVFVEEHIKVGGLASIWLRQLCDIQSPWYIEGIQAATLGVENGFGRSAYSALDLYREHGLDRESIAKAAKSLVDQRTSRR